MGRRRNNKDANSLIVMTPMIDVMTVLLAVFVVTAPMMTTGIDLDLPRAGRSVMSGNDHAVQVSVDSAGRYYLGETRMTADNVVKKIIAMRNENSKLTVMINGDASADYGAVMSVMGKLKDVGIQKVGLRTRLEK